MPPSPQKSEIITEVDWVLTETAGLTSTSTLNLASDHLEKLKKIGFCYYPEVPSKKSAKTKGKFTRWGYHQAIVE
jgi:hypothetical protein